MHDLDRTLRAYEPEIDPEAEAWELGDDEAEYDTEYDAELSYGRPLSEQEESELAAELLTLSDDAELDYFLGKVFKRVGRGLKKFAPSLGKILKPLAKKLLPIAGGALGTFFGGPAGAALGGKLGSLATKLFEVDLESMDPEEQQMEVATRFVRLASAAAQQAAAAPPTANPSRVARAAVAAAAKRHAPGLIRPKTRGDGGAAAHAGCPCRRTSGRWIRRGHRIVLLGA